MLLANRYLSATRRAARPGSHWLGSPRLVRGSPPSPIVGAQLIGLPGSQLPRGGRAVGHHRVRASGLIAPVADCSTLGLTRRRRRPGALLERHAMQLTTAGRDACMVWAITGRGRMRTCCRPQDRRAQCYGPTAPDLPGLAGHTLSALRSSTLSYGVNQQAMSKTRLFGVGRWLALRASWVPSGSGSELVRQVGQVYDHCGLGRVRPP